MFDKDLILRRDWSKIDVSNKFFNHQLLIDISKSVKRPEDTKPRQWNEVQENYTNVKSAK